MRASLLISTEIMARSIEMRAMQINQDLLKTYRDFLSTTRDDLAATQFQEFVIAHEIPQTKKLQKSYLSLFKALDGVPYSDMPKILTHRFLFEALQASPKKRERDLRRVAQSFCEFVKSAGSKNTFGYRLFRNTYADNIKTCIGEMDEMELDKKASDFSKMWIMTLRERLDTKGNKG